MKTTQQICLLNIKLFTLFTGLLLAATLRAQPFGLAMGDRLEKFGDNIMRMQNGAYKTYDVPAPLSRMEEYWLAFDKKGGLSKVLGKTMVIATSSYGDNLRKAFDRFSAQIEKEYGEPSNRHDFSRNTDPSKPIDWMRELQRKERALVTFWDNSNRSRQFPHNVECIMIEAFAINANAGYVIVSFEFSNYVTEHR